ncbi:MAG: hypothetical protein EXR71_07620 [Myxococcales bacterium]|nr:hypothetical protein [Myxococcales bacterium]
MTLGRDALRAALAAHAGTPAGLLVGEGVGVAGLCAGLGGNQLRTPLSEAGSVGVAVGLALAGRAPVVELIDIAGLERAGEALAEAAGVSQRSGGAFAAAVVVVATLPDSGVIPKLPPGVALGVAGVPEDAAGLLAAAFAAGGPVVLLIADAALDERGGGPVEPLGVPVVRRAGAGATLLAEGAGVALALAVTRDTEVIDLRGCRDPDRLAALFGRTGRVVLVGHGNEPLVAALGDSFWRLETRPVFVPVTAGADALEAALSHSFSP